MTLGVIARADDGGLAQMTCELVRHVRPDGVLVVDLGPNGRGPVDLDRVAPYTDRVWVADTAWSNIYNFPTSADSFFIENQTVYTAETPYDRRTWQMARGNGGRVILHAMPELLNDREVREAHVLWLPTDWLFDAVAARRAAYGLPAPILMPVPVATDRFEPRYRRRTEAEVFFVHGGEAFHDRNGLDLVLAAAALIERPCRLIVRGGPWPSTPRWQVGHVSVEWLPAADDYVDVVPVEADVLLMPRRYGGLTLPVQEAAAQGCPTVMSNLSPQTGWLPDDLRVPMLSARQVEMKGGHVSVFDTDPRHLAAIWESLMASPERVARASDEAYAWAQTLAWSVWADRYSDAFEAT